MSLKRIKMFLRKDKLKKEKLDYIKSVPPRFYIDAYDTLEWAEDLRTIDKAWDYFIEDIFQEMTMDEKIIYGFGTRIDFQIEKRARNILNLLINKKGLNRFTNEEIIKEVENYTNRIKNELLDCVYQDIQERNFKIIK